MSADLLLWEASGSSHVSRPRKSGDQIRLDHQSDQDITNIIFAMLTEQFVAAVGVPATKTGGTSGTKDVGVFVFESQPLQQPRAAYKKSTTNANCVAVSASHVFAAQADKAVVNVYSREKGGQEATVPFPERITCITLACEETVLVLGSVEGRIFLWEVRMNGRDM